MTRVKIATVGRYGATVNVFTMTLDGEPVARVEWREGTRKTMTFRGTKRDRENAAKAYAEGVLQRMQQGEAPAPARLTVRQLWDAYTTAQGPDWRPKTTTLNLQRWRVFTLHVNPNITADLVQPETLDGWRKTLLTIKTKRGVPMARNQVAHHIQLVKSVWKFARQRKLLRENVLADYAVRKGRDYNALEVPEYSGDEWGKILQQLDYHKALQWRAWCAIALDGLLAARSNALLQLRWADVDLTARTVTWVGRTDKVGKTRIQPLPRAAVMILRVCRVWAKRDDYTGPFVFYGAQKRTRTKAWTYSALNQALHTASRAAGVTPIKYKAMHSLRRMVGGNVLATTGDITKVGDWLGDSDVRVLRKSYLRQRAGDMDTILAAAVLPTRDTEEADG